MNEQLDFSDDATIMYEIIKRATEVVEIYNKSMKTFIENKTSPVYVLLDLCDSVENLHKILSIVDNKLYYKEIKNAKK